MYARQGHFTRWTIGRKIGALAAIGIFASIVLALVANADLSKVHRGVVHQVTISQALRNHLEGDMMHDALRADVLAAFEAGTTDARDAVRADFEDHSQTFRDAIATNKKLDLPESVRDPLASIDTPLEAYIASANHMVTEALADPTAARNDLPAFMERFSAMEDAQAKVSDAIEKASTGAKEEAANSVDRAKRTQQLAVIVIVLVVAALGYRITRGITRPLRKSVESLQALAAKDLTNQLEVTTKDELREMADALNGAFGSLSDALGSINGDSETVANAAQELAAISEQLQANANESSNQAMVVAAAGEEVSASVDAVAAAVEEMTASVGEIASGSAEAARVAQDAVGLASRTSASVNRLGEASSEIGNVVGVITTIAEQTNLLALNATIEAARAGESGKGFAVVANEVKELATETAKATDDIARRVAAVQAETREAVASIEQIAEIIGVISDHQNGIAGAIEEQAATTAEIGRSVAEAARATAQIAENITGVATTAASTAEGVTSAQASAGELATVATNLRGLVAEFSY
jgi:methyl-accepting chemotaxis protein